MKKRKPIPKDIEDLSFEETYEEAGFHDSTSGICDAPKGTTVALFSFENDSAEEATPNKTKEPVTIKESLAAVKKPDEALISSSSSPSSPSSASTSFNFNSPKAPTDTRTLKSGPNGKTPSINGETFDLNRTFTFRKSTIRHLLELKAAHPDINVYLNTIVDKALNHYYDYILNKNGSQG